MAVATFDVPPAGTDRHGPASRRPRFHSRLERAARDGVGLFRSWLRRPQYLAVLAVTAPFVSAVHLVSALSGGRGNSDLFGWSKRRLDASRDHWLANRYSHLRTSYRAGNLWDAFVVWPVFAACASVLLSAGLLTVLGYPAHWAWGGATTAAVLAALGGTVCGLVIPVRAVGLAGVWIGTGFGVAHTLVAAQAGGWHALASVLLREVDPFTRIVGGPLATRAASLPPGLLVGATAIAGVGIAAAARAMAVPEPIVWPSVRSERGKVLRLAAKGSAPGAAIGILFFATTAMRIVAPPLANVAFCAVSALLGGIAVFLVLRAREVAAARASALAILYATALTILTGLALRATTPGTWTLVLHTAAMAMFHAQYFTLAWIYGEKLGGPRAGVGSAAVEGVAGFVGFVALKAFVLPAIFVALHLPL